MKDQWYRYGPLEKRICEVLRASPRALTTVEIADRLGVPRDDAFNAAMNRLRHTEAVRKVGTSNSRQALYVAR